MVRRLAPNETSDLCCVKPSDRRGYILPPNDMLEYRLTHLITVSNHVNSVIKQLATQQTRVSTETVKACASARVHTNWIYKLQSVWYEKNVMFCLFEWLVSRWLRETLHVGTTVERFHICTDTGDIGELRVSTHAYTSAALPLSRPVTRKALNYDQTVLFLASILCIHPMTRFHRREHRTNLTPENWTLDSLFWLKVVVSGTAQHSPAWIKSDKEAKIIPEHESRSLSRHDIIIAVCLVWNRCACSTRQSHLLPYTAIVGKIESVLLTFFPSISIRGIACEVNSLVLLFSSVSWPFTNKSVHTATCRPKADQGTFFRDILGPGIYFT